MTRRFLLSLSLLLLLGSLRPTAVFATITDPPGAVVNSDSTLLWDAARRLTWADFCGTPAPTDQLHALTAADIAVQVTCSGDKLTVSVQAIFRPFESWTRSPDSAPLLRHEQVHFDLTEIHARLLRARLGKLRMTCRQAQTDLQPLIDAAFATWKRAQDQYDEESNHGLDPKGQARWEQQVAAQLKTLP